MNKAKYLNDVLSNFETEDIVNKLKLFNLEEYGSLEIMKQYTMYEKLNMQSHKNSLLGSEDYIMNAFVNEEKIKEVIKNLFTIELFRLKVFPLIKKDLANNKFGVKAYICLHFESIIVNLLEKFLYFITACQEADNYLLDIVEYCYYYISSNLTTDKLVNKLNTSDKVELENVNYLEDLENKQRDIEFAISIASLSIIRFISDHLEQLPFPITNHLLNSKDIPLLLVEVIDIKPWEKRNENKEITHIYQDNKWEALTKDNSSKLLGSLNKYEAQAWITIYNLFMVHGSKYEVNDFRKNIILKLKKHMNQRLYDQIPPLINLYRALEELTISGNNLNSFTNNKSFLVEMIPELYMFNHTNKSDKVINFENVAKNIKEKFFDKANIQEEMSIISEVYSPENLDYFMENPKCGNCGNEATNRCSQCKTEWYCSKECQIIRWKNGHKEFCLKMKAMNKELEKMEKNKLE